MYTYNAKITRIIDGNTVDAVIDLGFGIKVSHRLELQDVKVAQLKSRDKAVKEQAKAAKEYLVQNLLDHDAVKVCTKKADSFGRYLADIYIGDLHLNQQLVDLKLAQPQQSS